MNPRIPNRSEYLKITQGKINTFYSLESLYPLAFSLQNQINGRILKDHSHGYSFLTQKFIIHKSPTHLLKIGLLSGTLGDTNNTLPEKEFESLIKSQIKNAQGHQCDLMMAWPQNPDPFYKHDFSYCGLEYRYNIKNFSFPLGSRGTIKENSNLNPLPLFKLYSQHSVCSQRSLRDIQLYLKIPNTKIFTLWDDNQNLRAFACVGKGTDLIDFIHEWSGDLMSLLSLFHFLSKENKASCILIPHHSKNLRKKLDELSCPFSLNYLSLIKIIQKKSLLTKVHQHAFSLKIPHFHISEHSGSFYLGFGKEIFKLDSEEDLCSVLFGPMNKINFYGMSDSFIKNLNLLFPMPLWIWGWDSL